VSERACIVVRITRHPLDVEREAFLRAVFGHDLMVVTSDIPYGTDPVESVRSLIVSVETDLGGKVVAIEAQAPFPVLVKLVERRRDMMGVALIRAQFERDRDGRAIGCGKDESGRDLLKFAYYEELERIELQTRRLGPTETVA